MPRSLDHQGRIGRGIGSSFDEWQRWRWIAVGRRDAVSYRSGSEPVQTDWALILAGGSVRVETEVEGPGGDREHQ
jgi:hypothetical protein